MAILPVRKLEVLRTPANGNDDFLYRVFLVQKDDEEIVYYALSHTQAIMGNFEEPPGASEIEPLIQRRASGWVSNYENDDGTVIEQIRARPGGSFEHPFVITPNPT